MSNEILEQQKPGTDKLDNKDRDKQHKQCQQWKGNILKHNNVMKFMMNQMEKISCAMKDQHFICRPCEDVVGGHFAQNEGIVLCENRLQTETQMAETMVHETIHAFDHCRAKVEWESNCAHHACSEIRAANLSGDCRIWNEFGRGHLWDFRLAKKHQDCVRRRALLSIKMNPVCGDNAEQVLDSVFDKCFNDLEPFDEIY
ncbi:hypothetical protein MIR68_002034 [Amoeboaphelidium protococcarum]|nr:hypothetical protein MIR68_002034 [Amoeboaphelidium protococcarum]